MTNDDELLDDEPIVFREIPLLIEIERWINEVRGIMWRPEFEERVDAVSVALFGITRAAAKPPKPEPADFGTSEAYMAAAYQWDEWHYQFTPNEGQDMVDYLEWLDIDIWDTEGKELRCAEWFVEQAIAATYEIGGAKFTPDGSGTIAKPDAEKWGEALAAEAAKFKSRR